MGYSVENIKVISSISTLLHYIVNIFFLQPTVLKPEGVCVSTSRDNRSVKNDGTVVGV
jgi:hypothetical protein